MAAGTRARQLAGEIGLTQPDIDGAIRLRIAEQIEQYGSECMQNERERIARLIGLERLELLEERYREATGNR